MRIAIFTDTFLPQVNGVTNTLRRFGDYLEGSEHAYIFITPDHEEETSLPYNMATFFSTPFFLYPECRFSIPNVFRMYETLDAFEPDVIFLMTEFTMGVSGLFYGQKHNIPVVSNYSTNFNTIVTAYHLSVFEKALDKYIRWFHNEADLTVTPSEASRKVLARLDVHNTDLFGRGIDVDKFSPFYRNQALRKQYGLEDKVVLLYVGRLSVEKDIYVLQEAMDRLNVHHKEDIALVMVGEGPMKETLQKEMPDNVIFTGYLKGQALSEMYASADIFAFPSSFETFGNVVLEASASGLPVVGVNKGGVTATIKHGETGFLAVPDDAVSFANHIESLIVDEGLRDYFSGNGLSHAKQRSWAQVFSDFMGLLEKVVVQKGHKDRQQAS